MIDAISFLIIIVLSIGLSQVFLPYDRRHRLFWIVAPGILLLFITHPMALVFAVTDPAAPKHLSWLVVSLERVPDQWKPYLGDQQLSA